MPVASLLHDGHKPGTLARCLPKTFASAVLILVTLAFSGCAPGSAANDFQSSIFSHVEVIGVKGAGLGQFTKPRSVAVDAADNLYVADMTGRVQKFSPEGKFLLSWQMPQTDLGRPKGMCRDSDGNIVVIEPHYSRVNHFSPDAKLVFQWGQHGTNRGDLAFPRAAVANKAGDIYVSEYGLFERVQRFTIRDHGAQKEAVLALSFGSAGNALGQFNRPEGLGMDVEGNVFVADSCNHRIQVFGPDGAFLASFGHAGSGRGELSYPYDVTVDRTGLRFVCEFGNSRIHVFDRNNNVLEIIGSAGAAPGRFANPWSIALDSAGNLYVADSMNHRVQKLVRRK